MVQVGGFYETAPLQRHNVTLLEKLQFLRLFALVALKAQFPGTFSQTTPRKQRGAYQVEGRTTSVY